MVPRLKGKVALITGGGTGIGAAIARRFARSGASVIVTGRRPEPLDQVAGETGGLAVAGDVTDAQHLQQVVARGVARFGGLDIVIANAGTGSVGDVVSLDIKEWQATLDVNLSGVMLSCRAALPELIKRGKGAIVLVSSVAGLLGGPEAAAYCSSKAALLGLTRSMALDYGPRGIRVNTLCPGWTRTPMSDREMAMLAEARGTDLEAAVAAVTSYLPLGRMAAAAEIAACAEFLVSDDASFVTGTVLVADGGGCCVDVGTLAFAADS